MKIAFDSRLLAAKEKTGIEWYSEKILRELTLLDRSNFYGLFFASLRKKYLKLDFPLTANFSQVGIKFPNILPERIFNDIWFSLLLPYYLKKYKFDIFHGFDYFLPKLKSIRKIVTIHDVVPFALPHVMPIEGAKYYREGILQSLKNTDSIITVSRFVKNELISRFKIDPNLINVVYLGVDHGKMFPIYDRNLVEKFRKKQKLPKKFILYIGALNKRKNLLYLINSFMKAKGEVDTKLVLVGRLSYGGNEVIEYIKNNGLDEHIIFRGYLAEKDKNFLYNCAEAVVLPSLCEGFGLPIVESMACGVPVIATDVGSIGEIIKDAGSLVSLNNEDEFSSKLVEIIRNEALRKDLIQKGLNRAKDFCWDKTALETLKVYNKLRK